MKDRHSPLLPSIPDTVAQLQHLTWLHASYVGLKTIPDTICLAVSLKYVSISTNELKCLPERIGDLTNLRTLNAENNKITAVPDSLWRINTLKDLVMSGNLLTSINPNVDDLRSFQRLKIDRNELRILPASLGELEAGCHMQLTCRSNPLVFPPVPLIPFHKSLEVVRLFMQEVKASGKVRCGVLKVLVLGRYKAGKTSIVFSIINDQPSLTKSDERTISIDRSDWKVPTKHGEEPLTVRFFDAGGQDTYAMTKQLFISQESLNMIVVDVDTYGKAENKCESFQQLVGFYLDNVLDRNPSAVCLIVIAQTDKVGFVQCKVLSEDIERRCKGTLTRRIQGCEKREESWIASRIQHALEHMSFVCVSAAVDTAENSGMSQLQTVISCYGHDAQLFPHVDYILPVQWHSLEKHLEKHDDLMGLPYCTGTQMRGIAKQLGLPISIVRFVVNYLHSLRSVLFYEKDPVLSQVVFHSIPTLVSVFKTIFRHDIVSVKYDTTLSQLNMSPHRFEKLKSDLIRDGVATLSLIIALMESVRYERKVVLTRSSVETIICLMQYFDLCYWLTERPPSFKSHVLESSAAQETEGDFQIHDDDHNRRLLIPWLLDHREKSAFADPAVYLGDDDARRFVVVQATVCFPFSLPIALFDRLSARFHRHQTYLRHWSRGALCVCGPVVMLMTEEKSHNAIVVTVKTPRSCQSRRRIWQLLLRALVDLEELCLPLSGAIREGHIMLRSFSEVDSTFTISLERKGIEKKGFLSLVFRLGNTTDLSSEVELLSPDEGE